MGVVDWVAKTTVKTVAKGVAKAAAFKAIGMVDGHLGKVLSAESVARKSDAQIRMKVVPTDKMWGKKFEVVDECGEVVYVITSTMMRSTVSLAEGDEICSIEKRLTPSLKRVVAYLKIPGLDDLPIARDKNYEDDLIFGNKALVSTAGSLGGIKIENWQGVTVAELKGTWGEDYVLLTDYADHIVDALAVFAAHLLINPE